MKQVIGVLVSIVVVVGYYAYEHLKVDVLTEPGGVFYVSDDRAGAIYRIIRNGS